MLEEYNLLKTESTLRTTKNRSKRYIQREKKKKVKRSITNEQKKTLYAMTKRHTDPLALHEDFLGDFVEPLE